MLQISQRYNSSMVKDLIHTYLVSEVSVEGGYQRWNAHYFAPSRRLLHTISWMFWLCTCQAFPISFTALFHKSKKSLPHFTYQELTLRIRVLVVFSEPWSLNQFKPLKSFITSIIFVWKRCRKCRWRKIHADKTCGCQSPHFTHPLTIKSLSLGVSVK